MTRVEASKVLKDAPATVKRVAGGRNRLVLRHEGQDLLAVVPFEDLQLIERMLEAMEDRIDVEDAERVLRGIRSGRIKTVTWSEAKRRLDRRP
ncbi:MAG: hypothetical protein HY905_12060 [Deltaproteobacteria bacterium]|nr:hypothetical protein [Deltaproteobacteria bacterium]